MFAAEEDFGISPVEAQACGTPVIAYGKGGVRESVRAWPGAGATGLFFRTQSVDALLDALARFEALPRGSISPHACRANAELFGAARFRRELTRFVLDGHAALLDEMAGAPGLADPAQHDDVAADGLARDGQAGRPAALGRV